MEMADGRHCYVDCQYIALRRKWSIDTVTVCWGHNARQSLCAPLWPLQTATHIHTIKHKGSLAIVLAYMHF